MEKAKAFFFIFNVYQSGDTPSVFHLLSHPLIPPKRQQAFEIGFFFLLSIVVLHPRTHGCKGGLDTPF